MYNGSYWEYYKLNDTVYCYQQIGQNLFDAYTLGALISVDWNHARVSPVFRRDFSDASMLVVKSYDGDGLWRRTPYDNSYVEVFYNNSWVPAADYGADLRRINAEASAAQQAANQASHDAANQLLVDIQIRAMEAGSVFLRPACAGSYNGC